MTISRIVDGSTVPEALDTYDRAYETPRIFRGELYFFDDSFRKINSKGQVATLNFTDLAPSNAKDKVFPGNDEILLFRANNLTHGIELWGLQ